jgi:hypothetical protein
MRRRSPFQQLVHVVYEAGFALASIFSRTINATIFKGSMYQTLSARAHMDANPAWLSEEDVYIPAYVDRWRRREQLIDFVLGRDHCKLARDADVLRMRRGLHRYGEGPNPDAED